MVFLTSPPALAVGVGILVVLGHLIFPHVSWSRKIPGPWIAKYTGLWYIWQIYRTDFHLTNIKLHREKGKSFPPIFAIEDLPSLNPS